MMHLKLPTKIFFFYFFLLSLFCIGNIQAQAIKSCLTKTENNETSSIILFHPSQADIDTLINRGLKKLDSCMCEENLQLWGTKDGLPIFGTDGLAKSGGGKPNSEGEDPEYDNIPILEGIRAKFSPNYSIFSDLPTGGSAIKLSNLPPAKGNYDGTIAITDTRLLSNNYLFNGSINLGYDFTKNEPFDVGYDNEARPSHGTRVSYLIEKNLQSTSIGYNILPLVVLDEDGNGSLFDLLCSYKYILDLKKNGTNIKVINSSLTYYGYSNKILKEIVKEFKSRNILLITASSNRADSSDCNNTDSQDIFKRTLKPFPASYSIMFNNVKTINTVYAKIPHVTFYISNGQKYSKKHVNLGVVPDFQSDMSKFTGYFKAEGLSLDSLVGTSYAAPIASAYYFSKSIMKKNLPNGRFRFPNVSEIETSPPYEGFPYRKKSSDSLKKIISGGKYLERNGN